MKYDKKKINTHLLKINTHGRECYYLPMTMDKYHWQIHDHDDDLNDPPCPHCHAIENDKIKLNI